MSKLLTDPRSVDTILAALRAYQVDVETGSVPPAIKLIASEHGVPLDSFEIDQICEELNADPRYALSELAGKPVVPAEEALMAVRKWMREHPNTDPPLPPDIDHLVEMGVINAVKIRRALNDLLRAVMTWAKEDGWGWNSITTPDVVVAAAEAVSDMNRHDRRPLPVGTEVRTLVGERDDGDDGCVRYVPPGTIGRIYLVDPRPDAPEGKQWCHHVAFGEKGPHVILFESELNDPIQYEILQ